MESYEVLKQELLNQKTAIESKGGIVNVANLNPSPAEITMGIKSIEFPNFSNATATEEDVFAGKTFYAGDAILKTGTNNLTHDYVNSIFLNQPTTQTYSYSMPTGMSTLKKYAFSENPNHINFAFNEDIETIDSYAFHQTYNFNFINFHELKNLKTLESYAMSSTKLNGIDISALPECLETWGMSAFRNSVPVNASIRFPKNLKSVGTHIFYNEDVQLNVNDIDFTNFPSTSIGSNFLYNLVFKSNLIIPEGITELGTYFIYNGCAPEIELPASITKLSSYAFNALATTPRESVYIKSITFKKESPPTLMGNTFATQHLENGTKFYVPDNGVEAYKALGNLSKFKNLIFPMSQKD